MGNYDSWMSVENGTGAVRWSDNIGTIYPTLPSNYYSRDLGGVRQIVLGHNGNYFIRGNTCNLWCFDPAIADAVNVAQNESSMEVVALGKSGAYIIQLSNGTLFCDLKGHYNDLEANFMRAVSLHGKRLKVSNATAPNLFKHANGLDDAVRIAKSDN
jgi:hypothetical protein